MEMKMITTSGVAQNGKGSGRKIEMTGVSQLETMSEGGLKNEQGEYKQGVADEKRILTNVQWKGIQQ
jgi:hypothetical protein